MHAMFVVSEIEPKRWAEAETMLKNGLAPQIKQAPGFVNGTWARSSDGKHGRSMILFESEAAARAVMNQLKDRLPPNAPVKIVFSDVFEVVHQV